MSSQRELEDRLSRIEAIRARQADAAEDGFSLRILRAWSLADLRRLEIILKRVEAGGPGAAITAAEQAWIDATMKEAKVIADAPRDLAKRLVELEIASGSETAGAGKLDLSWLSNDERQRLRSIVLQIEGHAFIHDGLNALSTADMAWLTELGARQPVEAHDG